MAEVERRPCRACNCPPIIVTGPNGKKIPLDARSQVYSIGQDMVAEPVAVKLENAYVSHFQTCSKANDFSGSKRR